MMVKSGIITITSQLHILAQDQPTTYPISSPDDGKVWHNNYNQPTTYPVSRPDDGEVWHNNYNQPTTYPVSIHILSRDQPTTYPGSRPDDGEVCLWSRSEP